jgi:DNA-binding response OmpR family regulator
MDTSMDITALPVLRTESMVLDPGRLIVMKGNRRYRITRMPALILYALMSNARRPMTTGRIMTAIGMESEVRCARWLNVHVNQLRKLIGRRGHKGDRIIKTLTNVGYMFTEPVETVPC